ncbi:hypothetical protein FA13DRAFT_1801569 [Coprinellus micaceus]|uniref:Uncharacterized protein n=1 Tax=Coprinellus micaceus TaxID=71717 RepID=A0A4Y7SFL6_COPMI|nr:hypothetical protein FA13DRAFT_1801569 [Coprinellus micaceus]
MSPPEARFYAARYGTPTGYTRYRRPQPKLETRDGREHDVDGSSELDDTELEKLINEWINVDGDIAKGGLTGASKVSANSTPSSNRIPSPQYFEDKSNHEAPVAIQAHPTLAHDTTQGPAPTSSGPPPAMMAPIPLPPAVPHPLIQGLMSRLSPETQAAMLSPDPDVNRSVQFTERDMDIVRRILSLLPQDKLTEMVRAAGMGGGTCGVAPQRRMSERLQGPGYGQGSNAQDRQTWWEVASQPAWTFLARPS